MIPAIKWLHISDIHLRIGQEWPRDHVLDALLSAVREYVSQGSVLSFILISGDLAYSGAKNEYDQIEIFLDKLAQFVGAPKRMLFCVPGNHDVQRSRQKLAFRGAREQLQSQNSIDDILSDKEEIDTLLLRLQNYKEFQERYFTDQPRHYIDSRLSYESHFTLHDIRFSILGLNSAWLSEGDATDQGKLLIGERQIIDTMQLSNDHNPHFCLAVCHHPIHLLNEFDRRIAQARIENGCMFYHCGHLHFPEIKSGNCIMSSAGASYETRFAQNSFSIVSLDIEKSDCKIEIAHYDPHNNRFNFDARTELSVSARSSTIPSLKDLAQAISKYEASAAWFVHYLSGLILGTKSEFPIFIDERWCFANLSVLSDMVSSEMKTKTIDFNNFRNLLKVFFGSKSLWEILNIHGENVKEYIKLII